MGFLLFFTIFPYVAVVIDTDGSAFITKAEFDSLKNNFQAQIDNYNGSIDSKIDGAIAGYLAGIKLSTTDSLQTIIDYLDDCPTDNYKRIDVIGKNNEAWFFRGWITGWVGGWGLLPPIEAHMTQVLMFTSPYWKAPGSSYLDQSMPRIDGVYECNVRFQRANASLYNISMWGQGNAIDEFQYGLRGLQQGLYNSTWALQTKAGTNWLALTPKNRELKIYWVGNNQGVISNANEQSNVPWGNQDGSIAIKNKNNLICLRWGNVDANKTPLTLTEPLMGQDGTYTDRAATAALNGWTQYTGYDWAADNTWLKNTVNTNYVWYTMNGTPATSYRNSKVYFFPGADDHNKLYKYDQTDIAGNYIKRTIDVASPSVWTGTTNDDGNGYTVRAFRSEYYPSYESQVLLKSVGAISTREECPVKIPVRIWGDPYEFNEGNIQKITECYWSRLTPVSGTQQKIGDCPIFFGGLDKAGKATIKGFNITRAGGNSEWQGYSGTKQCLFGLSKHGKSDEVLNTSTNKYEIKNCIPFKYRTYGSTDWIDATGPITVTMGDTPTYEIQLDVEKNTDYYLHLVDPVGTANGYDEQHIIFRADMSKYQASIEYES